MTDKPQRWLNRCYSIKQMNKTYKQLRQELDEILRWFEGDDIDIEEALKKHHQALELITQLEKMLKSAELKITKV